MEGLVIYAQFERHEEYDFGSYKRGRQYAKEKGMLDSTTELILCNDSCYGPVYPLENMFNEMGDRKCDFWGCLSSEDFTPHLQSFFCVFKAQVFKAKVFDDFFNGISKLQSFSQIVLEYEVGLCVKLKNNGFVFDSFIPLVIDETERLLSLTNTRNKTLLPLTMVKKYKFPFIKRKSCVVKNDGSRKVLENIFEVLNFFCKHDSPLLMIIAREEGFKVNKKNDINKLLMLQECKLNKKNIIRSEEYKLILKSKLFNKKWYFKHYAEVKDSKIDPIEHYLKCGWENGYEPSDRFSGKLYLDRYPDVKAAGINPLVHFLKYGKKEGRLGVINNNTFVRRIKRINNLCNQVYKTVYKGNNKQPLVSVVVASYNYAHLISKTLDSLLAQTYKNIEIIVVDDGSKDDSVRVIKKYVKKYDNVFFYKHRKNKNCGLSKTLQLGIKMAKGEYIAFCESDDLLHPNNLEEKIKIIRSYKAVNIISNNIELFGDTALIAQKKNYIDTVDEFLVSGCNFFNTCRNLKVNLIPTFSCVMIKREILLNLNFNSPIPAWLDFWLYRQILSKYKLFYTPKKLTSWYIHKSYNTLNKAQEYEKMFDWFLLKSEALLGRVYRIKEYKKIKKSKYFDSKYYKQNYGYKIKDLDPLAYYLVQGYKEGDNPSADFSNDAYLTCRTDVWHANKNPLIHYEQNKGKETLIIYKTSDIIKHSLNKSNLIKKLLRNKDRKLVLLISHEMTLTGAPRALLNMAISLKKLGMKPIVLSWQDGPIRKEFLDNDIELIIDICLLFKFIKKDDVFFKFLSVFDVIVFNTLASFRLIEYFPVLKGRKIAWIHEGKDGYDQASQIYGSLSSRFKFFDNVYSVGEYSKSFTDTYMLDKSKSQNLLYGIPELSTNGENLFKNKQIKYLLPGSIERRKGQYVLLSAIQYISDEKLANMKFYLCGKCLDQKLLREIRKYKNITYLGMLSHDKLMQVYKKTDVILCPSLDDPMPITCTEAMILRKPIVVSEATGTASFITDGVNGFRVPANDPKTLAQTIIRTYDYREKLGDIGKNGWHIYNDNFTMEVFDKNIQSIFLENERSEFLGKK